MKKYYYVYRVGNEKPTVKHDTLEDAARESGRLAAKYPGDTFEILKCIGITKTTATTTSWMDGETPSEPIQQELGPLKVGDSVKCIYDSSHFYGQKGTVIQISPNKLYVGVEFPEKEIAWYDMYLKMIQKMP